ncbi:hypothetical protein L207DRAFT_187798 [Hyaloscypha variabilis F]|uniref:Uncharacterized protein n=1 Tax=Hyaloscypha variabilis (strain UAMH 11265 / GT02V1 / F) TaxID=1149755 RepID=A0A2J6R072_HYAVF|nr:hypothetical protein L207DRAFT_187798 [Hyaloscypha variabilis F]
MASYHRVLKVFGRSIEDKTLQCDCDLHPWEVKVNGKRLTGRLRLIGFVDLFFLISYSGNSRFHDGYVIYKDDDHIETILSLPGVNFESIHLPLKASDATSTTGSTKEQKVKYHTFTRDTVDYVVNSIGHRIGLQTQYDASSLKQYTIKLRKPQDALLKRKYKNAIKQHDTLDMLQDAVKLGLVSYAEILGHGLSHIYRGGSTLDVGKGFVGGLGASKERRWAGLSGDKA